MRGTLAPAISTAWGNCSLAPFINGGCDGTSIAATRGCAGDEVKVTLTSDVDTAHSVGAVSARAPATKIRRAETPIPRRRVLARIFIFIDVLNLALHSWRSCEMQTAGTFGFSGLPSSRQERVANMGTEHLIWLPTSVTVSQGFHEGRGYLPLVQAQKKKRTPICMMRWPVLPLMPPKTGESGSAMMPMLLLLQNQNSDDLRC